MIRQAWECMSTHVVRVVSGEEARVGVAEDWEEGQG